MRDRLNDLPRTDHAPLLPPPPSQYPTPSHSLDTLAIRWKPKNFWGEWGLGFGLGVWVQFQLERFGSVRRAFECFPPERKLKWRNLIKPHTHTHPHPPTPTHTHWAVHGKSFNYVRRRLYRGGRVEIWNCGPGLSCGCEDKELTFRLFHLCVRAVLRGMQLQLQLL